MNEQAVKRFVVKAAVFHNAITVLEGNARSIGGYAKVLTSGDLDSQIVNQMMRTPAP